jgi:hypothetical protein
MSSSACVALNRLVGFVGVVFGVLFLLYLFVNSTLLPPEITGLKWWMMGIQKMFSPGVLVGTLIGIASVAAGMSLLLMGKQKRSRAAVVLIVLIILLVIVGVALT